MRAMLLAAVLMWTIRAEAAAPAPTASAESTGLRSIAGWLKNRGTQGFVAAEVADAMGIPRGVEEDLVDALQRGFREEKVLRMAQVIRGEYLLFMVQAPGEVSFYLSTLRGGLRKAMVSVPGTESVTAMSGAEAQSNFLREVLYWEDKAGE